MPLAEFARLANSVGELRFMAKLAHLRLFGGFVGRARFLGFQLKLVLIGFHLSGQQSRIYRNYERTRQYA